MDPTNPHFDMIFSLNKSIQDINLNPNIDADLEYTKFKEQHLNVYLTTIRDKDLNVRNKIIEHLLIKLSNLISTKSKVTNFRCLDEENIICTNQFECKLKLIEISFTLKRKTLNEKDKNDLLLKIITIPKKFILFMENNSLDFELKLEIVVLVKRVLKKIVLSSELNKSLIDDFLIEMIRILDNLNRDLLEECFGHNPFSNLFAGNKYLKCLNLYLDYLEKHSQHNSSLALGKIHLENFILTLVSTGALTRIIQEKTSDDLKASFLNDYHIKLIHLSLRILIYFEIIVNESQIDMKLCNEFLANQRGIHFREDVFQLDLIYISQDDDVIIEFNLRCLNYQIQVEKVTLKEENFTKELFSFDLNVHVLFVKLLISIMFDYQVLVDWLISSETNFLTYFMRYLKVLLNEMSVLKSENINRIFGLTLAEVKFKNFHKILASDKNFVGKSEETNLSGKHYLDKTHQLLIELNSKIKQMKRSFPYNCDPLVKLLDKIVNLV